MSAATLRSSRQPQSQSQLQPQPQPQVSGRDALLEELLAEACHALSPADPTAARAAVQCHLREFPGRYAVSLSASELLHHMQLLARIRSSDTQYVVACDQVQEPGTGHMYADSGQDNVIVKITIICADVPKIFNHINTVLEQLTLSTVEASIMSTTTGVAFDEFISTVHPKYSGKCKELEADILALLLTKPTGGLSSGSADSSVCKRKVVITKADEMQHNSLQHGGTRPISFTPLDPTAVQLIRKIGSGHVCETYEGFVTSTGTQVAVKKPLTTCTSDDEREKYTELWRQELALMKLISRHPNICEFVGYSDSSTCFDSMYLCYEYLSGGCLADIILDTSSGFDPIRVGLEVASGMLHLHQLDIIHRDLKPANVILDSKGCAKIADFGLSCRISIGNEMTAETGTYRWMAPEVIRHEHYSLSADVYSFGILFWELHSRMRPFDELTPFQAAYQVAVAHMRPTIPPDTARPVVKLLQNLWHRDQSSRPTFDEICLELHSLMSS